MSRININGNQLTIEQVVQVARYGYEVEIEAAAQAAITRSREIVDRFVEEKRNVYGITTGFGKFSDIAISKEETKELQRNLIISHACGVGPFLSEEISRAIMLLRVNALSKGFSGIRLSTVMTLVDMINKGVTPLIPEKGSLGASGDLAPLSHMVLVMLGLGEALYKGEQLSGAEAMSRAGIPVVELTSKEGLALINGTQVMTAVGCITVYDAINALKLADISAAMTMEALNGITDAFDPRLHAVRPHQGQMDTASNLLRILSDSGLTTRQGEMRVQDAYSLRCVPQIHGASKDAIRFVKERVEIEINSVTDNPIIFPDDDAAISGGNFHGQPVALAFDFLGIAIAEMANACERRIERLVNPQLSGLPAFLTPNGGLHSGFMIAQYSAAALVSENKVLAHPASVDSIPSSANQEDHVSMGTIAARKARDILTNTIHVLAVELLAAAQGIEFKDPEKLGKGTAAAFEIVRGSVPKWVEDREMYIDLRKGEALVRDGEIVKAVEAVIGELKLG
ncbi:histidine ammonia-lyase [Acidaminobacter hydrogenoformans]|uniref:Histidine ammonia-lyase n=1 Tax=Acidaminobacter hydrogenoformans DSM 2784 TaxID=1120920 RepID=A0A1G5S285_9FIRM|nr:histidine ammonia-lyase [Acidaminobacter hydrogenoformans]SCZ79679.1 histidine ammonia-lyase [Acidaminobacter hydrogenoformans DSM 2784]